MIKKTICNCLVVGYPEIGSAHSSCRTLVIVLPLIATMIIPFQNAQAAQLTAILVPQYDSGIATFTATKFIELQYPYNGSISRMLDGTNQRVDFIVNGTEQKNALAPLISAINKNLLEYKNSPAQINSLNLHYTGTINGKSDMAELSLSVAIMTSLHGYVLSHNGTGGTMIVDMNWRGIAVDGPMPVPTQHANIDINSPAGLLRVVSPELTKVMLSTSARPLLSEPILDFREIGSADLNTWHWLFDPSRIIATKVNSTGFQDMGSAKVMSVYSLGECSLKQTCPVRGDETVRVLVDNDPVNIRVKTPLPNAQIQVAGYSNVEQFGNNQVLAVDLSQRINYTMDSFPFQVLLVLGGMMGAIAVFVLRKARN